MSPKVGFFLGFLFWSILGFSLFLFDGVWFSTIGVLAIFTSLVDLYAFVSEFLK